MACAADVPDLDAGIPQRDEKNSVPEKGVMHKGRGRRNGFHKDLLRIRRIAKIDDHHLGFRRRRATEGIDGENCVEPPTNAADFRRVHAVVGLLCREAGELPRVARIGEIEDDERAVHPFGRNDQELSVIAHGHVA